MRRLLIAGLLYLLGIAILLVIKPRYMFREDGRWKEFGIGRDPANFTHLPFWLFTIVWAMISYLIVLFVENPTSTSPSIQTMNRTVTKHANVVQELVPGYYMLNEGATGRNGVPRYVYLGPEEP